MLNTSENHLKTLGHLIPYGTAPVDDTLAPHRKE